MIDMLNVLKLEIEKLGIPVEIGTKESSRVSNTPLMNLNQALPIIVITPLKELTNMGLNGGVKDKQVDIDITLFETHVEELFLSELESLELIKQEIFNNVEIRKNIVNIVSCESSYQVVLDNETDLNGKYLGTLNIRINKRR